MIKKLLLLFLFSTVGASLFAQHKYYNADQFPLIGRIDAKTLTRYERLPAAMDGKIRKAVWVRGKCSSGMAVRFSSDAKEIAAKWTLLSNKKMNHMAYVGIKGLDLYAWVDGSWQFVRTARPTRDGLQQEWTIISNMSGERREYMLYLPLYDGVTAVEIGVNPEATVDQPKQWLLDCEKPVVCYGSSITQGGCASRPGMCYSSILSRMLNREFINLGFSGNALLDYEIAEVMGNQDAGLYILDFLPNVSPKMVHDKTAEFYRILRERAPETPILFVEHVIYPMLRYEQKENKLITELNIAIRDEFKKLKQQGEKNIYFLDAKGLIDIDRESTVDGEHFTDLGFFRMATGMYPTIKKILKRHEK